VPVIGIRQITTVPQESNTILNSLVELLVGPLCVGIAHVVQNGNGESGIVSGSTSSGETQDIRNSGTVRRHDPVVVGSVGLESSELDIVEEL